MFSINEVGSPMNAGSAVASEEHTILIVEAVPLPTAPTIG